MQKTVIITNYSGGLYSFRRELISELIGNGNEVFCVMPEGEKVDLLENIGCKCVFTDIDRRGMNPLKDIKLFFKLFKTLGKLKPDKVITYTVKPNVYGGFACRLKKVDYFANITGLGTSFQGNGFLKKLVVFMYKIALKKAKVVFFENSTNMQIFLDEKIIKEEQAHLLSGAGVNLEHFAYTQYPECDEKIEFLFIGRVMKEKGVEELFAAAERLNSKGINFTLNLVGPFEEDYSEKIHKYEKVGWLKNHGFQSDVRPFIEKCHCFVLPSWHEGMANTNLESAAMGRPLITSNIPGCKEAVIDGKSGLLCEAQNPDSLYEKMLEFSQFSSEEKAEMGRIGRAHMEKVFDKRVVVADTIKQLQ
ncbi:MAG: glycosyltransferase family 4 protein [Clostridia bacterium]|nr:glycosyltransferase family 4 protein [Clostridia bacterium]